MIRCITGEEIKECPYPHCACAKPGSETRQKFDREEFERCKASHEYFMRKYWKVHEGKKPQGPLWYEAVAGVNYDTVKLENGIVKPIDYPSTQDEHEAFKALGYEDPYKQ